MLEEVKHFIQHLHFRIFHYKRSTGTWLKKCSCKKFQPRFSQMRYEGVERASRVHRAGEIPVPGLEILAPYWVNKHARALLLHISLKMQPASQPVNPAVTVSEQRAAFFPFRLRDVRTLPPWKVHPSDEIISSFVSHLKFQSNYFFIFWRNKLGQISYYTPVQTPLTR